MVRGRDSTTLLRPATSAWSRSTSSERRGALTVEMDGAATSTTLSANWARFSKLLVSGLEASTMRTFAGKCWRNSSRRKELSMAPALSPNSCCIRLRSCVGLRSPNSSALNSCCRRRCSEAAVRCISCCLSVS